MPSRDSTAGFLLYYVNLGALIVASIMAASPGTPLWYLAVILSLLLLVAQDVTWLKACYLAPQDRLLLEKIANKVRDRHTNKLLREYDFGNYLVNDNDLGNLESMQTEWIGVDYEFQDRTCQENWQKMLDNISALLDLLKAHSKYRNASNFFIPDKDAAAEANHIASQILACSEELRRIYIRKMPRE